MATIEAKEPLEKCSTNMWKALSTPTDSTDQPSVESGPGRPVFKLPLGIPMRDKFQAPIENPLESTARKKPTPREKIRDKTEAVDDQPAREVPATVSVAEQEKPLPNQLETQFPYKVPSWSGIPETHYSFEVLKGGVIVSTVDLSARAFTVFGRMTECHVPMEHPSVSRYHAVVQYRSTGINESQIGFYVYDLDSTHGTFLNKQQLRPRTYTRLHVGHVLKFGGSSRLYILQGPGQDQEEESALTVTELKQLRMQQGKLQEEHKKQAEDSQNQPTTTNDDGIDWGFGDDAVEEIDMENPFALSTPNEDLYLNDPKKTLRGWFEREGFDLEYDVQEKGFGHFLCKINLPIDSPTGEPVIAESSVQGKKKEAVAACALEACRILDRSGLLRQSHHEGRKRKEKNWEEADYYDSDEDIYFDRTGTIEKKREMRMKQVKKDHPVETYDSLVKKLEEVHQKVVQVMQDLQHQKQGCRTSCDTEQDSLDSYMSSLQSGSEVDKKTISKLRLHLSQLRQEESKLQKLVDIARPSCLPDLVKQSLSEKNKTQASIQLPATGDVKGFSSTEGTKMEKTPTIPGAVPTRDGREKELEDNDPRLNAENGTDKHKEDQHEMMLVDDKTAPEAELINVEAKPKLIGPVLPPESASQKKQVPKNSPGNRRKKRKNSEGEGNGQKEYDTSKEGYEIWLPPEGQSGDGRTSLNDKYGY